MNKRYKKLTKRYQTLHFVLGAAFIGIIWLIVEMLMPMGKYGDKMIYKYQVDNYLAAGQANAVKNIAKNEAFYNAMAELGVEVSEDEVSAEMSAVIEKYGGLDEFETLLIDTTSNYDKYEESVRKSLYQLKAREVLYKKNAYTDEDYLKYYNEHLDSFTDEFENVRDDVIRTFENDTKDMLLGDYLDKAYDTETIQIYGF